MCIRDSNQADTVAFVRRDKKGGALVVVCNFSPVDRTGYRIGVPAAGQYTCIFNTDDEEMCIRDSQPAVWQRRPRGGQKALRGTGASLL